MPVYNGERFIREAAESVLQQTFPDFELLILDDGSTDSTPEILRRYFQQEPRIRVHRREKRGFAATLNNGMELARGTFIARMDADDLAHPTRLKRQVDYLTRRPEVGILGTSYWVIDERGRRLDLKRFPTSDLHIRWANLLAPAFAHPSVMLRRDVLLHHGLRYDPSFPGAEDFELWIRLLRHTRGANLDQALLEYREHPSSMSSQRGTEQLRHSDFLALSVIKEELPSFPVELDVLSQLRGLFVGRAESPTHNALSRVSLGNAYLDMLAEWTERHLGDPELPGLHRAEAARVAALTMFHPRSRGWWPLLVRLLSMSHLLPADLVRHYARALGKRFELKLAHPTRRRIRRLLHA
jgi:hypothetical protein